MAPQVATDPRAVVGPRPAAGNRLAAENRPAAEDGPAAEDRLASKAVDRLAELAESLHLIRERIQAACITAHRDPTSVRLLAVTKTFPATDVALLADLGLTDFAESRDSEAAGKAAAFTELRPAHPVRWHMVGRLQRNKARSVVNWASEIQSVDSIRLTDAIHAALLRTADQPATNSPEPDLPDRTQPIDVRTKPLDVLVQASIDGDIARGGCPLPELIKLSDHIAAQNTLRLRGVMAVAPLGMSPEQAFERLASAAEALRASHPDATELSAGMSGDLEAAIACGSTCVRVGTALLGGRRLASP